MHVWPSIGFQQNVRSLIREPPLAKIDDLALYYSLFKFSSINVIIFKIKVQDFVQNIIYFIISHL